MVCKNLRALTTDEQESSGFVRVCLNENLEDRSIVSYSSQVWAVEVVTVLPVLESR